jgi:hypothetical protein
MLEGIEPASISGSIKMSDQIDAAIKNIEMYLDNVESYDESLELLTNYALPQLHEVRARLRRGIVV